MKLPAILSRTPGFYRFLMSIVLYTMIAGCSTGGAVNRVNDDTGDTRATEWITIGLVDNKDRELASALLDSVLRKQGVRFALHGSRIHALEVPGNEVEIANRLIDAHAPLSKIIHDRRANVTNVDPPRPSPLPPPSPK